MNYRVIFTVFGNYTVLPTWVWWVRNMAKKSGKRIDRRTVLKGIGIGAIGVGGTAGVSSAHHVADLEARCGTMPSSVVAGESFGTDVWFESGHGTRACFVAAVSKDGSNWTQVGQEWQDNLTLGEERTFTLTSSIPQGLESGDYTWRVSATELPVGRGPDCPEPGETDASRHFIRYDDCPGLEIRPPVEVHDVSFRGCSEVWVAFDSFPVSSTSAQVNVNGSWRSITISQGDLTRIPGQYGDRDVFKYSVSGGDKIGGLRIVGSQYDNGNRCAQNI